MVTIIQKTYLYIGFFIFGLFMLAVFPFVGLAHFLLPVRVAEQVKLWCMKFWASSFYTFGVWFVHKGTNQAQAHWPNGPVIVVANHNSLLDTPAIYLALKRFALPLAKVELTRMPIFGHLNKWITLPVNRKSAASKQQVMETMHKRLLGGGSLLIFPEGRMNKGKSPIQPFESGAFRLSHELGVPIVTMLVFNTRYCLAGTSPLILRPGIVTTVAGPVFLPNEFSGPLEMQKAVFQWYESRLGALTEVVA